jgi:anion-transporting  ArsA/GET3 family ATPase
VLQQVLLVTGKGGVGKTTVAAALAYLEARSSNGSVLIEFGDGDAGRRALGDRGAPSGLEHVVLSPRDAITALGTSVLGSALLARAVLGNFAVERFLRAAPAIREVAMLEAVRRCAAERPGRRVVVDMPATGHGVAWLRVPAQLSALLGTGPLFDVTERLGKELIAPDRCGIVIVTLPERLVMLETLELWQAIRSRVGLSPTRLVINRFPRGLPEAALGEARALAAESNGALRAATSRLAAALEARASARAEGLEMQQRARGETGVPPLLLPEQRGDPDADTTAALLQEGGWQ